ncbi:MAG: Hint domain-containing protein, partial [Acetobacteraceae bacterium]|nr:Hint domain-containing protein [Acetobacteraceae bacterium]
MAQTFVISSGVTTGYVLSAGDVEIVSSGGTASGTQVLSGAVESALAGGTVSAGVVAGGTQFIAGAAFGEVISSGGTEFVQSGGYVSGTVVLSGGSAVFSSGSFGTPVVDSGGTLTVGGIAYDPLVSGGGLEVVSGAGAVGEFGGLLSGAVESIGAGGTDSYDRVSAGATLDVLSGGLGNLDSVIGGSAVVAGGGTLRYASVVSGGQVLVASGGVAARATVFSGAIAVQDGGLASGGTVSSGALTLAGAGASSTEMTIANGGTEVVSAGATSLLDAVGPGGEQIASSGATISGLGVQSGGAIFVDNGAALTGVVVSGGGAVDVPLTFTNGATASYDSATNVLTVSTGGGSATVQLGASQPTPPSLILGAAPGGGTQVTFGCYAGGTRILTPRGEVAVETLRAGDLVTTARGEARSVRWMGRRHVDFAVVPHGPDVSPVRVRAGAFGEARPRRDLWLSPEHAVLVTLPEAGEVLIPVRHLIDDAAIVQECLPAVTYWHVELESHDILLADGLPAESWLDTGNRAMFENAPVPELRPHFVRGDAVAWQGRACVPLVEGGALLAAARAQVARAAAGLGLAGPGACEATLAAGVNRVSVPAGVTRVHLRSPAGRNDYDSRRLGALLTALQLEGAAMALDDPRLVRGFHDVELHPAGPVRWTNGA